VILGLNFEKVMGKF